MKSSLYEYQSYKSYLLDYEVSQPRGFRRRLAEAAGCQFAYISHVFNRDYQLSLEQAEGIAKLIHLTTDETEYFLTLVNFDRAGTASLKSFFKERLREKKDKYLLFKNQVEIKESLKPEDQAVYYSRWYYAAIHMLLTIPKYRHPDKISSHLHLSPEVVRHVLEFLRLHGLAKLDKGIYRTDLPTLWLEKDSPLIVQHHTNWRLKAIEILSARGQKQMHHSLCFSLSADDIDKVRELLAKNIAQVTTVVKKSAEERLCALNMDFFEIF